MKLVIVESPTKAKTLSRYLGGKYEIMASMGHIRDLPKSNLGIDLKHDFKPEYVEVVGKEDVIKKLKIAGKKVNEIILSMDPDREGEAIAYHVKHIIGGKGKFKRVVFHQITRNAIEQAFDEPRNIDLNLVHAQQARRVLDRLVGYTLSPVLWKKIRRGLSAGRVQSVAVRLIVEREREIEAFKPQKYWEIGAELYKKAEKDNTFIASLKKIDGKGAKKGEFLISKEEDAKEAVGDLENSVYKVLEVKQKEVRRRPYPPFTTSTLQQSAANALRYTAKRTMRLAQQLYEMGYITYHRTDSVHLADEAVFKARKFIKEKYGANYLPSQLRRYKAKSKLAQEAHEAIRPTRVKRDVDSLEIKARGVNDLKRLYSIIWNRFVASQMSDAIYDQTTVDVQAKYEVGSKESKEYLLRATGNIRKFEGWRKLFKRRTEDRDIPKTAVDEILGLSKVVSDQKATEPPPRYNDASLVKALEERGIGRPSTYAPTISTILARQYVEYESRRFVPTPVGITASDFLVEHFPESMDYDFTAGMEEDLDKIAQGKREWVPVLREFWSPFHRRVESVEKNAKRVQVPTEPTGKKCPDCKEGDVVIRVGRFGKFLSCSRFPDCKFTDKYVEKLEGVKCPDDGGDIVIKRTRKGKQFYGCSNYPNCKWASWRKPTKNSISK
jgi:DNA topoisomerase-1